MRIVNTIIWKKHSMQFSARFPDLRSSFEKALDNSTYPDVPPDLTTSRSIRSCVRQIQTGEIHVRDAVTFIGKKLMNDDERIVCPTLHVLERCTEANRPEFFRELATQEFMNVFRQSFARMSPSNRISALELLRKWTTSWASRNEFLIIANTYTSLMNFASPVVKVDASTEQEHKSIDESISVVSFDELSDHCSCIICGEMFDSTKFIPRSLDCGHTFCQGCIYNDKVRVNKSVKCPICPRVTELPDDKILQINYFAIGIVERLMQMQIEPKLACKSCSMKFPPASVRICVNEDCQMGNLIICLSCVVDRGHLGHNVVKYDIRLKKIREEMHAEVTKLSSKMDSKKEQILRKIDQLVKVANTLKMKLMNTNIPVHVIEQIEALTSEQEADKYKEIVNDLANTLMSGCDSLEEAFDHALKTANNQYDLFDDSRK